MRRSRSVASAAALIVVAGCSLQPNAIVPEDGAAVDGDTSVSDTRPDGPRPDGGPTCSALSTPHIVEILAGDALLRAPDAVFEGTEIEPPGNVTLQVSAYRHGAWAVDGYDAELLNDPPNLPDLVGGTPRMRTFRSAIDTDLGGGELPYGLVLDADDRYTIEIAGELYLTAGDNEVHIDVDDRVVFAVDVDDTLIAIRRPGPGSISMTIAAPRDDWYPVHGAWQNGGGPGRFDIEITPPADSRRSLRPDEMRVRAAVRDGREVFGWSTEMPDGDPDGSRIDDDEASWTGSGPFPDVGVVNNDRWSMRWVGRYRFADTIDDVLVISQDSHRLWVGGVFLGGDFGGDDTRNYDTHAPDGIVDMVLELTERTGGSEMTLRYDEDTVSAADFQPYTRFGGVPHGRGEEFNHTISSTRMETLDLSGIPGDAPSAVEVSVVIVAPDPSVVTVTVTEPGGLMESRPLSDAAWSRIAGYWHLRWVPAWASTLDSADGTWEITVDNTGPDSVRWLRQGVLAHFGGIAEPRARSGTFRTAVVDLGDETLITGVRAGGMITGQANVRLAVRAAANQSDAMMLPFTDTDAVGDLGTPIAGRYVQIQASLSGPGWETPRVRDLRIVGQRCLRCAEMDPPTCPEERVTDDLIGLWAFEEGGGGFVRDLSGYRAHDLIAPSTTMFRWDTDHIALTEARFNVDKPVDALREAIEGAEGLTLEVWVRPANDTQTGPARIFTISDGPSDRNLTLGQDGNHYEGRIRRAGVPSATPFVDSVDSSVVAGELQHVVLTRATDGAGQLWVDGTASGRSVDISGAFDDWDPTYRLLVGDESDDTRPWAGEIHMIALYRRALSAEEIIRHQRIGPEPRPVLP